MNILVDVDDTLTNYVHIRNSLIKKYIQDKKLPYKIVDINCTKSAEVANWPIEECCNFWHEVGCEEQLKSEPQKDASLVMQKLKSRGYKIFIVTARPDIYFPAYEYTKQWLDNNHIPYDKIITGKLNKKQEMIDNKIDVVIDDSTKTIGYASELGIKSLMFTTVENSKANVPKHCVRVNSWNQIEEILINKNFLRDEKNKI